ncbi:hypothetical protein [Streptomyces sp. NPDC096934]
MIGWVRPGTVLGLAHMVRGGTVGRNRLTHADGHGSARHLVNTTAAQRR